MEKSKLEYRLAMIEDSLDELTLFEQTLNTITESICLTDINNNILFINKAFQKTYGYLTKELLGENISQIYSPENSKTVHDEINSAMTTGCWEGELFHQRKDLSTFLVSMKKKLIKDEKGEILGIINTSRDLSEELKTRHELKLIEDRYHNLFWELKEPVFESSPAGKFLNMNPAGLEMFGYTSLDEILGLNIGKEFYANPKDRKIFRQQLERDGYVKDYPINYKRRNGKTGTVLETAFAIKNEKGEITSYWGILQDITQIIKTENELRELNKSKDKLFSIIAHDLRGPFGSLLNFSEFLVEDINELTNDEIKLFASKINESSRTVFNLLENLLQWSRMQTGRMEYTPRDIQLNQIINQCIGLLKENAGAKNITIINNICNEVTVFADHNMLSSIIRNLLTNGIKFTYTGGEIILNTKPIGKFIEINVTDTGVGISEDKIDKLFNIDTHITSKGTADEEGTGLGLILCKEMVTRHGGIIFASSINGNGTTFTFTIPKIK